MQVTVPWKIVCLPSEHRNEGLEKLQDEGMDYIYKHEMIEK